MNIKTTMKAAKIAVSSKAGRTVLKAQKNSPVILMAVGVVGVVGTAVLASKATLKLDDMLDEHAEHRDLALKMTQAPEQTYTQKHYEEDVKVMKLRLARDIAWVYTPAVLCGAVTIGAFTGSHVILQRRYAGSLAAYAALDKAFKQYRAKVVELVGEEKERELHYEVVERQEVVDGELVTVKDNVMISPYAKLFSKETSTEWVKEREYRLVFLRCQQAWANDRLKVKGHLFLNDVYRDLGFEDTTAGAAVGWIYDNPKVNGDNYIDFGIWSDSKAEEFNDFMSREDGALWLDFNVDGQIFDLIELKKKRA